MIQDNDEQIEERYEKSNPYRCQLRMSNLFKDFFREVFDFDKTEIRYTNLDDGEINTNKTRYVLHLTPEFMIRSNKHLKEDQRRELIPEYYVASHKWMLLDMNSTLDLLSYQFKKFIDEINNSDIGINIMSEPIGISHNATVNTDMSLHSYLIMNLVIDRNLQSDDLMLQENIQFQITLNETYYLSSIHMLQWTNPVNVKSGCIMIDPIKLN